MRILIAEDDFASRKLMQKYLIPYGVCEVVVDGAETLSAFAESLENNKPLTLSAWI